MDLNLNVNSSKNRKSPQNSQVFKFDLQKKFRSFFFIWTLIEDLWYLNKKVNNSYHLCTIISKSTRDVTSFTWKLQDKITEDVKLLWYEVLRFSTFWIIKNNQVALSGRIKFPKRYNENLPHQCLYYYNERTKSVSPELQTNFMEINKIHFLKNHSNSQCIYPKKFLNQKKYISSCSVSLLQDLYSSYLGSKNVSTPTNIFSYKRITSEIEIHTKSVKFYFKLHLTYEIINCKLLCVRQIINSVYNLYYISNSQWYFNLKDQSYIHSVWSFILK